MLHKCGINDTYKIVHKVIRYWETVSSMKAAIISNKLLHHIELVNITEKNVSSTWYLTSIYNLKISNCTRDDDVLKSSFSREFTFGKAVKGVFMNFFQNSKKQNLETLGINLYFMSIIASSNLNTGRFTFI